MELRGIRRCAIDPGEVNQLTVEAVDAAHPSVGELHCAPEDAVEDGLEIRGRARDHAQDLARRGLLLQGLGQVAFQLGVRSTRGGSLEGRTTLAAIRVARGIVVLAPGTVHAAPSQRIGARNGRTGGTRVVRRVGGVKDREAALVAEDTQSSREASCMVMVGTGMRPGEVCGLQSGIGPGVRGAGLRAARRARGAARLMAELLAPRGHDPRNRAATKQVRTKPRGDDPTELQVVTEPDEAARSQTRPA